MFNPPTKQQTTVTPNGMIANRDRSSRDTLLAANTIDYSMLTRKDHHIGSPYSALYDALSTDNTVDLSVYTLVTV